MSLVFTNPAGALEGGTLNPGRVETWIASEAISEGEIVSITASQTLAKVSIADAATTIPIGVAMNEAEAGDVVEVCVKGICPTRVSGTNVAIATQVSATTNGLAHTASSSPGGWIVGYTLEATGTTASTDTNGVRKAIYVSPQFIEV